MLQCSRMMGFCFSFKIKFANSKGDYMSKNMYALTNPQKSIWQTGEFYKGTSIENIAGTATILEKVDFKKFEKAINLFIEKNENI